MPVWFCLTFTLVLNYRRHRQGKSTLCSAARKHVPAGWFITLWSGLSGWLIPHYCNPAKFPRKGDRRC